MKAVALKSTPDTGHPKGQRNGHINLPPISPWFTQLSSIPSAVIQRKAGCACGGGCPECKEELEEQHVQPKLAISTPGDPFEQEADRVADQVMRMTDASGERGDAARLQFRSPPSRADSAYEEGQPLPAETRAFFEPRFGHDFSEVRIHTGAKAEDAARSVSALAYTVGRDVVFGSGRYAPETVEGKQLLAHELTHVLQQGTGTPAVVQRQPDPQALDPASQRNPHTLAPLPNSFTFDVLDPVNTSFRFRGFGAPSVRDLLNGASKVRRLLQPPATDPMLNLWPQSALTDDELRTAACRALPALCDKSATLQLQLPEFHAPRLVFHGSLTVDHFVSDGSVIPDRHRPTLDQKATEMIRDPAIMTDLVGHTDTHGEADDNQQLSERRAQSVRDYLLGRSVPSDQIWSVIGLGESRPKFSNDATDNLAAARNRRVEMGMRRLKWEWTVPRSFLLDTP